MKLLEQKNHVKTSGTLQTTAFKLQMSAKMARILSDGIYSDKIKAVIRELSTNAFDSHVMAGKPNEPIRVTLPSSWTHNFIIEDFGVGLSPKQIDEIYTVYGQSDKEDSNDSIGCLGLGSKSIFAYGTRTATIESVYNGMKYSYSAYIAEDNMPVLTKLGEVPTTQCNGVKITVPVNRSDVYNFAQKAKEVYEFFDPKPIISGNSISFDTPNVVVKGDNWELRESGNSAMAVMGVVAYPITLSDSSLSSTESKMIRHPFYVNFDIGDLDIEVSREGLSYDIRTKTNILARFRDIRGKLSDLVEAEVQQCKNLWEARLLISEKSGVLYDYINRTKLEWKGEKLFPNSVNNVVLSAKINYYSSNYSKKYFSPKPIDYVEISRDSIFIRNDLTKGIDSRVYHYVSTNFGKYHSKRIYLVADDKEQDLLVKELGIDKDIIVLASTLPKPTPKARVNTGTGIKRGNTHSVMEFVPGSHSTMMAYYKNVEKDFDEGGQYFEFNTFKCNWNKQTLQPSSVSSIVEALNKCNKPQGTIYAIKTAKVPKLSKTTKPWTEYISSALNELDIIYSSLKYTNLREVELTLNRFGHYDYKSGYNRLSIKHINDLSKLVTKKDFLDFVKKLEEIQEIAKSNEVRKTIETLYNTIGRTLPAPATNLVDVKSLCDALITEYDALNKNYTLLSILSNSAEDSEFHADTAVYINSK